MSTIIRCDRCGNDHAPSEVFALTVELCPGLDGYTLRRDLCRTCFDALRIWLQGEGRET